MDRVQAVTLIEDTFGKGFDESRFTLFIRNLLNHVDEEKKTVWTSQYIKAAFRDYVNHFKRLGTYIDPSGELIDILAIHLNRNMTLTRGRVTLRNFVADYLATGHGTGKAAVIAAFVSPDKNEWRFSFVKLERSMEKTDLGLVTERIELTPARRYSYLVGEKENCHTAKRQFIDLLREDSVDPSIEKLEDAFKVERVTTEFFEHYRKLFERTRKELDKILKASTHIAKDFSSRGITTDDFAKKLIGQIVFLYFLQKKGWFGVKRGKRWGEGEKDYIRQLFIERKDIAARAAKDAHREPNFFNDILEHLFYDALAVDRSDNDHFHSLFNRRIPFLNGGLFEPLYNYDWEGLDILLPDELFSNTEPTGEGDEKGTGILDVFDRYNFTVSEAEPLEKEVAVDPEMLGKVFENLLPDNEKHRSGTYYTPRVIVHYMCQQALLNYLSIRSPDVSRVELEDFLKYAERFADFEAAPTEEHKGKRLPPSIMRNARGLDELLAAVTVCDPAIGSGAFPVGMMLEIVRARAALTPALDRELIPAQEADQNIRSSYNLKRHAIQQSLYGVDLDPGAVEIAKLRLWLSMVVDEEEFADIQPLPNLDYKIMQGDSLVERFNGLRLLDESQLREEPEGNQRHPRLAEIEELLKWGHRDLVRLQREGRLTQKMASDLKKAAGQLQKERDSILKSLDKRKPDHPELELGLFGILKRIRSLHTDYFSQPSRNRKESIRKELDKLEWKLMRESLGQQGHEEALAALEVASATHRKPFFLWKLQFNEVFQHAGGFDIVLANPPYVRQEQIRHLKAALKDEYDCYSGMADIFVYFYERSITLLKPGGAIAFITSNKWYRANYGEKLREWMLRNTRIRQVIDFGDAPVFDAVAYPTILIAEKRATPELPGDDEIATAFNWPQSVPGQKEIEQFRIDEFPELFARSSFPLKLSSLTKEAWQIEPQYKRDLLSQIQGNHKRLGEWCNKKFYYGIKTGLNQAFVVDRLVRDRLISEDPNSQHLLKPFLRGRDIKRWHVEFAEHYLIKIESSENVEHAWSNCKAKDAEMVFRNTYPSIYAHFQPLRKALIERSDQGRFYWELRSCDYWGEFEKPKIILGRFMNKPTYAYDTEHYYHNDALYLISGVDGYTAAVLNSPVSWWYLLNTSTDLQNGYIQALIQNQELIPIPQPEDRQRQIINSVVRAIHAGISTPSYERLCNGFIYELYFPNEFAARGIRLFEEAERAGITALYNSTEKTLIKSITKYAEEAFDSSSVIYQMLFDLQTIDPVRIIEGKS